MILKQREVEGKNKMIKKTFETGFTCAILRGNKRRGTGDGGEGGVAKVDT